MGAWSAGPFDNDGALDWVLELEGDGSGDVVRSALAVSDGGYIEAPEGSAAVAAAEVVAACLGRPAADLPDGVAGWVTRHGAAIGAQDVVLAVAALGAVTSELSELRELWAETAEGGWAESIDDLRRRLASAEGRMPEDG